MRTARFRVGTTVLSGLGTITELPSQLAALGTHRIAVVADRGVATVGVLAQVLDGIDRPVVGTHLADPDPTSANVEEATAEVQSAGDADVVLAVGGGSALCLGKAVALRLRTPRPVTAYEGGEQIPTAPLPVVAVPTTAGSGSEVSESLVLHDPDRGREIVIRDARCAPRVAILDGQLLRDLPDRPLVHAALDALSHAAEALWVKGRSHASNALARAAIGTIIDHLPRVLEDRMDVSLQELLEASCSANLACGNTGLGLVHALSSSPAVSLPHGYQNGALLQHVATYNQGSLDEEDRDLPSRIQQLYAAIGFPGRFQPGEVGQREVEAMLHASRDHPFRRNNAVAASDDDIRAVLERAAGPLVGTAST